MYKIIKCMVTAPLSDTSLYCLIATVALLSKKKVNNKNRHTQ